VHACTAIFCFRRKRLWRRYGDLDHVDIYIIIIKPIEFFSVAFLHKLFHFASLVNAARVVIDILFAGS
jgi:hypothetical protein